MLSSCAMVVSFAGDRQRSTTCCLWVEGSDIWTPSRYVWNTIVEVIVNTHQDTRGSGNSSGDTARREVSSIHCGRLTKPREGMSSMYSPTGSSWKPDPESLAMQRLILEREEKITDSIFAVGVLVVFVLSMVLFGLSLSL